MKQFTSLPGAHKYAENSSRKHSADRYVIYDGDYYYVEAELDLSDTETLIAHYFDGNQIKAQVDE